MTEKKKFLLRLDGDLFHALEKWAADDLRSVNAQIEFLLRGALRAGARLKDAKRSTGDDENPGDNQGTGR